MSLQDQQNAHEMFALIVESHGHGDRSIHSFLGPKRARPSSSLQDAAGARPPVHTTNLAWTPPLGVCRDTPEQVQHIPGAGEVVPQTQDLWVVRAFVTGLT